MSNDPALKLMAIFAHPDDESFAIGGTLARYGADPDIRVVLVCATRGEAGEIADPRLATPERLGEVREQELRCACDRLGIDALYLLDYRDSGMEDTAGELDSGALIHADADEATGKIVEHIRRERPDVLITFNETGGSGHRDHIAIHHFATAAFAAAGDPARYPDQIAAGLKAHQAKKLYYTAIPQRFFRELVAKIQEMGIEVPKHYLKRLEKPWGLPDEACTTDVPIQGFWETKMAALQCHATQLKPDHLYARLPPEIMRDLQVWECFQLVESTVGSDGDTHDLFAGLRT